MTPWWTQQDGRWHRATPLQAAIAAATGVPVLLADEAPWICGGGPWVGAEVTP